MSRKIGLIYGSNEGHTTAIAEQVKGMYDIIAPNIVELVDIGTVKDPAQIEKYDYLIWSSPTWNIGEMQSDWEGLYEELDDVDFSGKKVAYFGPGDQVGYADNFQDAMGQLEEKISSLGGATVGQWSTEGYDFEESKAVKDGKFVGLALDEDNQPELTESRIQTWVSQLKPAFGIS